MDKSFKIITYKSLNEVNNSLHILSYLSILIFVVTLIGFALYIELYEYVLPAIIALPFIFLLFIRPKIWLYTVVLALGVFFHASDEGVSFLDVAVGFLYIGSISLWMVKKVLINREKIIYNWGDWAIITFFGLLLFNFFIAVFNDVQPDMWAREYLLISIMLIYFPIRDILKTERDIKYFLIVLGFVIVLAGFFQLYQYYTKMQTDLVYAYELKSSITINQTLYTIASIFAFILAFSQKTKFKEILIVILTSLYVVFLISTFSRTFWLMLGASIILMFFFLPTRKKISFLTYIAFMSFVLFFAAFLFMREQADVALKVAFSRFESTSAGKKDPSLIARFKEWERLEYLIKLNPLGGNGLAKSFTFHFPLNTRARHTTTIHNGYLWLAFRTGIPLSLLFLFFVTFYTIRSAKNITLIKNQILRAIIIACFSTLLSMYVFNFTSAQYFTRDGMIVLSFTIALIEAVNRINKQEIMNSEVYIGL